VLLLGLSPLICAIYGSAPKRIVELLLDRGADPNIESRERVTVLHVLATNTEPGSLCPYICFQFLYL
jgi:ankyrin repeat protein